ncbi:uncharacterized protein BDR25DRAFT_360982 [Lindgomyces ingoldianus]|uniref:Uncharacterized protein n=1 Tax=Lindgomyces ingoldianus TaxID=673940 RepID=A0ACB6QEP6_9PLEO|nr:uncharacterized protein BDR25DRAFT_360982 [Lindgomyces ingoldianus]KAF2465083.1 hypothetical protein BDR25DRAFT_360982 [Lindgomyces ingoldianus]
MQLHQRLFIPLESGRHDARLSISFQTLIQPADIIILPEDIRPRHTSTIGVNRADLFSEIDTEREGVYIPAAIHPTSQLGTGPAEENIEIQDSERAEHGSFFLQFLVPGFRKGKTYRSDILVLSSSEPYHLRVLLFSRTAGTTSHSIFAPELGDSRKRRPRHELNDEMRGGGGVHTPRRKGGGESHVMSPLTLAINTGISLDNYVSPTGRLWLRTQGHLTNDWLECWLLTGRCANEPRSCRFRSLREMSCHLVNNIEQREVFQKRCQGTITYS